MPVSLMATSTASSPSRVTEVVMLPPLALELDGVADQVVKNPFQAPSIEPGPGADQVPYAG